MGISCCLIPYAQHHLIPQTWPRPGQLQFHTPESLEPGLCRIVVIWCWPTVASKAAAHLRISQRFLHQTLKRAVSGSCHCYSHFTGDGAEGASLPTVTWLLRGGAWMPWQPHVSCFSALCSAVGQDWIPHTHTRPPPGLALSTGSARWAWMVSHPSSFSLPALQTSVMCFREDMRFDRTWKNRHRVWDSQEGARNQICLFANVAA